MSYLSKIQITGMAFHRDDFIKKFRERFEGCLKEYAKLWVIEELNLKDFWSNEITRLSKRVYGLLDPKQTKVKGTWNRYSAAAEAFLEAAQEQGKLHQGIAEFKNYSLYTTKDLKKINTYWVKHIPDSNDLALEIVERFFPEPYKNNLLKALKGSIKGMA